MARLKRPFPLPFSLPLLFIVPIIFFLLLISCGCGNKLRKQNLLDAMGTNRRRSSDGNENEKLLIEWPQGWRRLLLSKFGRALPTNGTKATTMPCCAESIGQHVCNALRNRNPSHFRKRCRTDADFGILQCCRSCRTNVAELGRELFAPGLKSRHCYDRHKSNFCAHFVHQSGLWAANVGKSANCNGDGAALAFRVCRRSCGFCEPKLYQQQNRNCISKLWEISSSTMGTQTTAKVPSSTENAERWKTKTMKTTTTKHSHPFAPSKSLGGPTSSGKPTIQNTGRSTAPSSASFLIVPPSTRRPISPPPRLRPCTVPPLPPLPPIPMPRPLWRPSPCLPLEPLAPLKSLTPATIATTTFSAPRPPRPTDSPFPFRPLSPIESPLANRRRYGTTITITWKPSSSTGNLWPELPISLPDEIIEAILNKLSGIDDRDDRRKEKEGRKSVESEESAERREDRENSAEKSEENGEERTEEEERLDEEGVAQLLLNVLIKAAKWAAGERETE